MALLVACGSSQRVVKLSSKSDLNALSGTKNYAELKKDYSVSKTIKFGMDPDMLRTSLRMAKENINYEVPERKIVFSATLWDLPLIKAYLAAQKFHPYSAVGEEVRATLMDDNRKYSKFVLEIDAHVNPYFNWSDWTIWLQDRQGRSYFPPRTKESYEEELVLAQDTEIFGRKTKSPPYKIFHNTGTLYFPKLDLASMSPVKLILLDRDAKRRIELVFHVKGKTRMPKDIPATPPSVAEDQKAAPPVPVEEPEPVPTPPEPQIDKREVMRIHFEQGTTYFKNEKYKQAILEWQKVLKLDPAHKLSQVKIRKAQGILEAIEEEQRIQTQKQQKRRMQVHFLMATENFKAGLYEEAISEWEKVLAIDPDHALSLQKIEKTRQIIENQ